MAKSHQRLKVSTFKLNALLDITLAINDNVSTAELLRRFEKILTADLKIGKVIIIKLGEKWECLLNSGFDPDFYSTIDVEKELLKYSEISFLTTDPTRFSEPFDIIIPVQDKDEPIAFVLMGDIDEEAAGISPLLKHLKYIQTLSNIIVVAIENKRLFKESLRQEAIRREMELASRMQSMLVPADDQLQANEYLKMYAFYHPHYDVGGDYYDFINLNEKEIGFCIADVSGKGISAAILMSNFQANLKALYKEDISLEELLTILNERVMNSAKGEKFITLFLAKYNFKTRELKYVNAGHNPPILYSVNSNETIQLKNGSVGMGMLDELPFINVQSLILNEHSKLLCYTDGLVEVITEGHVQFGTEQLESELKNKNTLGENIASIIEKQGILEGNASIFDDISILSVEFTGN